MTRLLLSLLPLLVTGLAVLGQVAQPKDRPKPRREAALKSKDDGKFFTAPTMKKIRAAADKLLKQKDIDLLVETVNAPPKFDPAKWKAMTTEEQEKFFKEYARERCKAEKLSGVYVVLCRNPGFVWAEFAGPGAATFPPGIPSRFAQTLFRAFQDNKYDTGLADGIQQLLDAQGLGEKKDEKKEEKK